MTPNGSQKKSAAELVAAAVEARKMAAAEHSGFSVGAALEDSEGNVWTGCNVESSSYGLSICAERVALFKAISEGKRKFNRIAVVAGGHHLATPCGACRQVLSDYASGIEVILYNPETGEEKTRSLDDLIPDAFGPGHLSGKDPS